MQLLPSRSTATLRASLLVVRAPLFEEELSYGRHSPRNPRLAGDRPYVRHRLYTDSSLRSGVS